MKTLIAIILLIIVFFLPSCKKLNEKDQSSIIGTYFMPSTGAILFDIKKDSAGFYMLAPENKNKEMRDSLRLIDFKKLEAKWNGYCSKSFDKWMTNEVIGSKDWRENFKEGLVNFEQNFYFIKMKKGYKTKNHIYSSGYCLIKGGECLIFWIERKNIEKL